MSSQLVDIKRAYQMRYDAEGNHRSAIIEVEITGALELKSRITELHPDSIEQATEIANLWLFSAGVAMEEAANAGPGQVSSVELRQDEAGPPIAQVTLRSLEGIPCKVFVVNVGSANSISLAQSNGIEILGEVGRQLQNEGRSSAKKPRVIRTSDPAWLRMAVQKAAKV